MNLQENTSLKNGEYIIKRKLGQGGFGITYLARQTALKRDVVIKEFFYKQYCRRDNSDHVNAFFSSEAGHVKTYQGKFHREATMLAGLKHDHIISVIDVWEENGTAYYSMPYLSDGSLSDQVENNGKLDEATALHYMGQIAQAVKYLHQNQMCHYDIKPDNIMLDNGKAVLIDFGLCKQYDSQGKEVTETPVGKTVCYAPIEQYGEINDFSPKCDIYALGASLYFLLTGKNPPAAYTRKPDGNLVGDQDDISPKVRKLINAATRYSASNRLDSVDRFIALGDSVGKDEYTRLPYGNKKPEPLKPPTGRSKTYLTIFGAAAILAALVTLTNLLMKQSDPVKQLERDMVLVEGGTFVKTDKDSVTQYPVSVGSFYISKYEVTQELWQAVMGENNNPSKHKGDRLPVENVSWHDCQNFIATLNEKTHKHYRLPTEDEWEFAARGGKQTNSFIYSGSNLIDEVAWYGKKNHDDSAANSSYQTHPVGQKRSNELGLYDMTGNVLEWTSTVYQAKAGMQLRYVNYVMRGGGSRSDEDSCRLDFRNKRGSENKKGDFVGFRLAM